MAVVALAMMACMSFTYAQDGDTEYEYTVEVQYNYCKTGEGRNTTGCVVNGVSGAGVVFKKKDYTLWASSVSDAREQAIKLCEYEFGNAASCGAPRTTGRKR